jgi:hypothetical protein
METMSDVLKPFAVTFEFSAIVMAADADSARDVAHDLKGEIVGDISDSDIDVMTIHEVPNEAKLSLYGWSGDSLPYGSDKHDQKTLHDIFEAIAAAPTPDTKTIDMFADASGDAPA